MFRLEEEGKPAMRKSHQTVTFASLWQMSGESPDDPRKEASLMRPDGLARG